MLNLYLLFSSVTFLCLGLIWGRQTAINLLIKITLFIIGLYGMFVFLNKLGFIINTNPQLLNGMRLY